MSPQKRRSHRVRQSRNSTQTTLPWAAGARDANVNEPTPDGTNNNQEILIVRWVG